MNKPQPREVHSRENSWQLGKGKWMPIRKMSNQHIRKAMNFAQRKEEFYWNECNRYAEMVKKLESEAKRRGIKLRDVNTLYHKNNRILKDAIQKDEKK